MRQAQTAHVRLWLGQRLPSGRPVVLREGPGLAPHVAQVDARADDGAMHLVQVRHVSTILRNLLQSNNSVVLSITAVFSMHGVVCLRSSACPAPFIGTLSSVSGWPTLRYVTIP